MDKQSLESLIDTVSPLAGDMRRIVNQHPGEFMAEVFVWNATLSELDHGNEAVCLDRLPYNKDCCRYSS